MAEPPGYAMTAERRFEQTVIAYPGGSAMFGQTFVVQQEQCLFVDPAPGHLANW